MEVMYTKIFCGLHAHMMTNLNSHSKVLKIGALFLKQVLNFCHVAVE